MIIKRFFSALIYFSQPLWIPVLVFIGTVISAIMDFVGTVALGIVLAWILLKALKEEVRNVGQRAWLCFRGR